MSSFLPSDVVNDIILRTLELDSSICDVRAVCRVWDSFVGLNIGQVWLNRYHGDTPAALSFALRHNNREAATWLASRTVSSEDSNRALVLVSARPCFSDIGQLLLTAPQHTAHADCSDGKALLNAAGSGDERMVRLLLDAPQHAAHANCQDGQALVDAAWNGHTEAVQLLLNAPQHAAHADCGNGEALLCAAQKGHIEIVRMLLDASQHAAHADSLRAGTSTCNME
eukprot:gene19223-biopygen28075